MSKKISAVFVTAQVQVTAQKTIIGSCLRQATLTPTQCQLIHSQLSKVMGSCADKIRISYYKEATIIWIELGIALCRRSLHREMRRFSRIFEDIGLAETAEVCSPFRVSYQ